MVTKRSVMVKKHTSTTFALELPLVVNEGAARRLRTHLEAARQLYNALLSQGLHRLRQMRADPAWHAARALPRSHKHERKRAFGALRAQYGFSEYAWHATAKTLRVSFGWRSTLTPRWRKPWQCGPLTPSIGCV